MTFVPLPSGGSYNELVVDHVDGNPGNNHASNLEWVTQNENVRRAHEMGLSDTRGVKNAKFKGYYKTPAGLFPSAQAAATALDTYPMRIHRLCKLNSPTPEGYGFIAVSQVEDTNK